MNMSGIERQGDLMYQFNGMIEKEEAFGLELYETPFRSYDAQLGRFWQVEPLADIYCGISMYQFGYNNPVSFNDPSGLSVGEGKDEKEEYPRIGNPLDITPIDGRVIGDYSPRGSSGSKIGGGGYTWDLGNTRGSPYSIGGRPGQGPAMITIANFGANKDVTKAVNLVRSSLKTLGLDNIISVKEETDPSPDNIGYEMAQGINAVYLLGEKNKEGNGEVTKGDYYYCMESVMARLNSNYIHKLSSLNKEKPEVATGWELDPYGKIQKAGGGNTAYIATDQLGFTLGYKLEKHQVIAIMIFHVMIHNAGIQHGTQDWTAPIAYGRRLQYMAENNFTYDMIVHPEKPEYIHSIWTSMLRGYFSKNLLNGSLLNLSEHDTKILKKNGFIR